jgi:hypothetical protein
MHDDGAKSMMLRIAKDYDTIAERIEKGIYRTDRGEVSKSSKHRPFEFAFMTMPLFLVPQYSADPSWRAGVLHNLVQRLCDLFW